MWVADFTTVRRFFRSVIVAAVLDSFSRKILAIRAFRKTPTCLDAIRLVRSATRSTGAKPDWIVTDRGSQFRKRFRRSMRGCGIRCRFVRVGEPNLSRMDRFWKTLKAEWLRPFFLYRPVCSITADLSLYADWYNKHRVHAGLDFQTPEARYHRCRRRKTRLVHAGRLVRENYCGDCRLPVYRFTAAA